MGRAVDDRVGAVVPADFVAERLRLAYGAFRVGHETVLLDIEHREQVAFFEAGRADEVAGLLAARRAVPEKVVGAPCNVRPFELAAVPVVGRIDDQRAFRSLDEYEPWLFVLDDFLPVDVLLVARDVQSPDGKVVRGFLAA